MTWFVLEPRDPLMVRDGRPFGPDTEGARSLDFPPPSVTAGALRTRVGFAVGGGQRFGLDPAAALQIGVVGPLLLRLDGPSGAELLLPAPRDALLFDLEEPGPVKGGWKRHRLGPRADRGGDSSLPPNLLPVGAVGLPTRKPARRPPAFWTCTELESWLGSSGPADDFLDTQRTHSALLHEERTHVGIDPSTRTAEDGLLFRSDGLRFASRRPGAGAPERLALLLGCDDRRLRPGLLPLGGERRIASLSTAPAFSFPKAPTLLTGRGARVQLLTPAPFPEGAVPVRIGGWPVVAAAVDRPLTLSGWDLERSRPKGTRRFARAGSVYWVDLQGASAVERQRFVGAVHLKSVAAGEQEQRDGFGLAAVGVWE